MWTSKKKGSRSNFEVTAKFPVGTYGKRQRLFSNAFLLEHHPHAPELCSYSVTARMFDGSIPSPTEKRQVIQGLWRRIELQFGKNFVFVGDLLFAAAKVITSDDGIVSMEGVAGTLKVEFIQSHSISDCASNPYAQAVYEFIIRKSVGLLLHHYGRVGHNYYSTSDLGDYQKNSVSILKCFSHRLMWLPQNGGPHCIVDVTYKPLLKKNIIDVISQSLNEPDQIYNFKDNLVRDEWRRRCQEATVCTLYNNKIYRVKCVRFDLTPHTEFLMRMRNRQSENKSASWEGRGAQRIPYYEYYQLYYNKELTQLKQPLLEAYSQKPNEQIFLMPELCALTGFTEELRKDRTLLTDTMKQGKVSAQERYNSLVKMGSQITQSFQRSAGWSVKGLAPVPLEVTARVLDDIEVDFGEKQFDVEEGQFQKWLRNGLQSAVVLEDWLFIYPETDKAVLDIWLQSLRDIGDVAFHIEMSDPHRVSVSDQKNNLLTVLEQNVKPTTQLVLLLTPQAEAMRVYRILKKFACTTHPVATQVVKSETIRKRQSIAAVLSRITLQINAKLNGPLWHVDYKGESQLQGPFFKKSTMVIGIDIYRGEDGFWMGCVASMDRHCASYFSIPYFLEADKISNQKCKFLQEFLHEALTTFLAKNDCLPIHIVVYRGYYCSIHNLIPEIRTTEVGGFLHVFETFLEGYRPLLTYVVCTKRVALRFFRPNPNEANICNPASGTVVDTTLAVEGYYNFYLINHECTKGTSSPTHYVVILDETAEKGNADCLQSMTYRLSFMYFNFAGSTKFPAPLMYAQKLAVFSGTAVNERTHHPSLKTTLYYL